MMNRTLTIQPTSRVLGPSGSGSHARQLVEELRRDFGLSSIPGEQRGRLPEFSGQGSDCKPPAELRLPGVVAVRQNHRTGQKTIEYADGRVETRAFVIAPDLIGQHPAKESPRIILALAELKAQRLKREAEAKKTPRQIVEELERRLYGGPPPIEPLSDREMEWYSDSIIAKPDDYWERLAARNRQQLEDVLARRAQAAERAARKRDAREAMLNRTHAFVDAVRQRESA